ncbi:MAG: T9SS type A sorting domain-containing protein [Bacteroidota bacterium]
MKKVFFLFLSFYIFTYSFSQTIHDSIYVAGFRASRILSSYPNNQFPSDDYWAYVGNAMASKFDSTGPAAVWIVSLYQNAGTTRLNFLNPGGSWPYITFGSTDQNESCLDRFDQEGFRVWLQVEPGAADVDTLIHLVMNQYKHHPCVKGFGIDVEWFNAQDYSGGQHVTDSMAQHWEQTLKAFDTDYTLFLKHYSYSWMPPSFRGDILFVDDSQGFTGLTQMTTEFEAWGSHFSTNDVAFQFGYPADSTWWTLYTDPPQTIGNSLRSNIPNCYGLFWVDFTICKIFDITVGTENIDTEKFSFEIFPNPVKEKAILKFELKNISSISIIVYDIKGNEIAKVMNDTLLAGKHEIEYNVTVLKAGNYFIGIKTENGIRKEKITVVH